MSDEELNALAAEKVLGWKKCEAWDVGCLHYVGNDRRWIADAHSSREGYFDPLHSIADAMRLVEKVQEDAAKTGWKYVEALMEITAHHMRKMVGMQMQWEEVHPSVAAYCVLLATPREHTLACLKAVGAIE